jgi:hypothetical protein
MKNNNNQKIIIIKDRVDLYEDFTINLLYCIYHYYLDKNSLSNDDDIYNHYSFCFNKVCDDFLEEEIDFKNNIEIKEYFYKYYYNQFYKPNNNLNVTMADFEDFWRNVFAIEKQRKRNLINVLVDLYGTFDKSFINKNIFQTV